MRKLSPSFAQHLAGEVTTIASCWLLSLKCGQQYGFTDANIDIKYGNITYLAATGFNKSAIYSDSSLSVDNLSIEAALDSDAIKEQDLISGKYDGAELEIFMVNYEDLTQGKIILKKGYLGSVIIQDGKFTAQIRGLSQQLNKQLTERYTSSCRAIFASQECGMKKENFTSFGIISSVKNNRIFNDNNRNEIASWWSYGIIEFLSGKNLGLTGWVKEFSLGQITCWLDFPYPVQIGDKYQITAGCDKNFTSCCNKFNNAVNFRGQPHLPGYEKII
jgi:uncharacterized phage protein (TIGR02218 family)